MVSPTPQQTPDPVLPPGVRGTLATGAQPFPLILLEGESKSRRSWLAAKATGDPRFGPTFWLELGETAAHQYGAVPGAGPYIVIDHDGTYADVYAQLQALHAYGMERAERKLPPLLLVIDTMTDEWAGLSDWATARARNSRSARKILAQDPDADITVSPTYWNPATNRHKAIMRVLKRFPGVVVMIANGGEVTAMDSQGNPIANKTRYRVEAQKGLANDATAWIRTYRDADPEIIGFRDVTGRMIDPEVNRPKPVEYRDDLIPWLVFDVAGCTAEASYPGKSGSNFTGGELTAEERVADPDEPPRSDPDTLAALQQDLAIASTPTELDGLWTGPLAEAVRDHKIVEPDLGQYVNAWKAKKARLAAEQQAAADRDTAQETAAAPTAAEAGEGDAA